MPLDWSSAYADMHAKGEALRPPACLHYVLEGVHRAARESGAPDGTLTPDEIIAGFRARARRDFGPLLHDVLEDWGLRSPAELGEAVLLLGRFGLLTLSPGDTPEAFAADARPLAAAEAEAEDPDGAQRHDARDGAEDA
jgi:uncharacterized repeat protein (TIGR04138 family)